MKATGVPGNWYAARPVHFDYFMDVIHPDDRALLREAVRGALEGDGQYETEYRVMMPDTTVRWVAGRGRVEFDQNGKPKQLRAISIDITERRQAEDEARDLNGRLITAHEDERARLARALHDDVTQRLALLAIDAGQKEKGLGDTIARQAMRSIRHDLVQLSEDVHALSYALHPAILEDLGLIEALKAECARFGAVEGIPTSFSATDNVDEPTQTLSLCLYRVGQEALRNVARHSSATLGRGRASRGRRRTRACRAGQRRWLRSNQKTSSAEPRARRNETTALPSRRRTPDRQRAGQVGRSLWLGRH